MWMQMWRRWCLDYRLIARMICKMMGTKRPSRRNFARFALTPLSGGGTLLKESKAFDVFAPDGYFRTEIMPRYADNLKSNLAPVMRAANL